MTLSQLVAASGLALALFSSSAFAGIADPDCTAEKAAKSAAAKSTVGVGGRCDAKEAAKDSGKKAVGVEDKAHIPHIEFVNRPEFPSHGGGWRQVLST
jgi:hypothetical protein